MHEQSKACAQVGKQSQDNFTSQTKQNKTLLQLVQSLMQRELQPNNPETAQLSGTSQKLTQQGQQQQVSH